MSYDGFEFEDYLEISSSIEKSIKSDVDIRMKKHVAWMRCAISRAYYAAFLSIRSEFERDPKLSRLLTNTGRDHKIVAKGLSGSMRKYLRPLHNLRDARNLCDYNMTPKFSVSIRMVEQANEDAKFLIAHSHDMARAYDIRRARI